MASPDAPPPLASPVKRSYRGSPSSSPDPGTGEHRRDEVASLRVLRTKLSTVADEVTLELPLLSTSSRKAVRSFDSDALDGTDTTPSTPPEVALEPLVGLGVELAQDLADGAVKGAMGEAGGDGAGAPQTLAAERQVRELDCMPKEVHLALAKLCSQHWASQYNSLKRTLAAAAGDTAAGMHCPLAMEQRTSPPVYWLSSFTPQTSPSSTPCRSVESSAASSRAPSRSSSTTPPDLALPSTPAAEPTVAKAPTTLTPSLANFNFSFSPIEPPPTTASQPSATQAEEVNSLLADLVNGEPVAVRQRGASVLVSETVPTLDTVEDASDAAPVAPASEAVPGLMPGMKVVNGVAVKTSVSHPINISPLVPPELLEYLSSHLSAPGLSDLPPHEDAPFVLRPSVSTDLLSVAAAYVAAPSSLPRTDVAPPALGNFVLSSCPGKKVRMNGEPRQGGRGAICRDVLVDLRRARDEYNVRLVVCCLDDTELAYLGVPWEEYAAALDALGMDVVRLPMVEGFAPGSVQQLDAHLARIVRDYTLRGVSVLAHCRGGIGRAGLVASCWMLKMGLVAGPCEDRKAPWEGEEPMAIVERVVELIRRRRSIKAIETPHQVHYLLQYITYLQQHARIVALGDLAPAV